MTTRVDLKSLSLRTDDAQIPTPGRRRHLVTRYVLPACLMLGFTALVVWSTRDVILSRRPVTVMPVHVSEAEVRTAGAPLFKAAGWIEPRPTPIRVAALTSGIVKELLVVEDEEVAAGEPVARLVDEDAQLALEEALAKERLRDSEVKIAEASLQAAHTNFDIPAHLELPVAEAEAALAAVEAELSNLPRQLERAEARLRYAQTNYRTKSQIRETIAALSVDLAQSDLQSAEAEVDELTVRSPVLERQRTALLHKRDAAAKRLELKTDERQAIGETAARLAAAQADLKSAQVAVATARLQLSRTVIPAPCAGRVLALTTAPGSQVGMTSSAPSGLRDRDMSTVVTLYRPKHLQVRVDVRFEDLPHVVVGQPILIENQALSAPLTGSVLFLTGFANIQKNTLEVKVSLEDAPDFIKPEMLVDVTFLAPEHEAGAQAQAGQHHVLLPRSLVESSGDEHFVWIADQSAQVARRRRIELGPIQTPTLVEVASGLNISSRIIISDREGLGDGDRIEIRGETEPATNAPSSPGGVPEQSNPRFH